MDIDRRRLVTVAALSGTVPIGLMAAPAAAEPRGRPVFGIDATQFNVRAGGGAEQTRMLQDAIDRTAGARVPLVLGPGEYRTGELRLPPGAQIFGVRGATRLIFTRGNAMIFGPRADNVTLSGLTLDGAGGSMAESGALVRIIEAGDLRIADCDLLNAGGNGILLEQVGGIVSGNTIIGTAEAAIVSNDARGLAIQGNTIRNAGNNGILVWRSEAGDDGTLVIDNRIEQIDNRRGGSGPYGNAINVFRAANVIVRGNRIARASFTAVRGNAASNIQIAGNSIVDVGEVAIYSEFGFEGASITGNTVDGAAIGVSVTIFNDGGRLAVVQGNLIRNLKPRRPAGTEPTAGAGIGIAVEADASVTGNVIENAPDAGISVGWGQYQRDVSVVGNVVRKARFGVTVSVAAGAGSVLINGNMISGVAEAGIAAMDYRRVLPGDLAKDARRFAHIQIDGNRVS